MPSLVMDKACVSGASEGVFLSPLLQARGSLFPPVEIRFPAVSQHRHFWIQIYFENPKLVPLSWPLASVRERASCVWVARESVGVGAEARALSPPAWKVMKVGMRGRGHHPGDRSVEGHL